MSGFSLPTNFIENPEKQVRRVRPRVVPPPLSQSTSEPAFQAPSTITEPMAEKTLSDFSVPSAANVVTGPNVDVGDVNFELKSSLINMVQASPFCGKPNEDANAHLQNFLELCKIVTIRGVTADAIARDELTNPVPSDCAKKCQQAFLAPLPGMALGVKILLST